MYLKSTKVSSLQKHLPLGIQYSTRDLTHDVNYCS